MSDELTAAKMKIAELEEKLANTDTGAKQTHAEDKLIVALKRLDALEAAKPKDPEPKGPESKPDEDDQCPECGGRLRDVGNGILECVECGEMWEEDSEE